MENPNRKNLNKLVDLTAWMPLFWLSLAFIAGILVAWQMHLARSQWLGLARKLLSSHFPFTATSGLFWPALPCSAHPPPHLLFPSQL